MMVMLANNTGAKVHALAHRFPGHVGHLYSPGAFRGPYPHLPYALDNGAFASWKNGHPFDEDGFARHLERAERSRPGPEWVLCPDVVADREGTLEQWRRWYPAIRQMGHRVAFACQDGMDLRDVPREADLLFIGGTTEWKWASLRSWCMGSWPVHVGRVNSPRRLDLCLELGAVSVDGTGWTRGDQRQWAGLEGFLLSMTDGLAPRLFGEEG